MLCSMTTDTQTVTRPLTVDEYADAMGISRRSVYELIGRDELKSFKIGRLRRIPPSELEDFPRRQMEQGSAA